MKNGGTKFHQLWKSVIWHMEEREGPSEVGAQRPQGESMMLEERAEKERKIKKTEGKRECSLEPRQRSVLKGKIKL